jgi:RHS repeat-associated protein
MKGSRMYSPWGALGTSTGEQGLFGFQGDYTDGSTGQVDMSARWYEPGLGRFSSRDVLFGDPMNPTSLNQFVYGADAPITFTDPAGMLPVAGDGSRREQSDAELYSQRTSGRTWEQSWTESYEPPPPDAAVATIVYKPNGTLAATGCMRRCGTGFSGAPMPIVENEIGSPDVTVDDGWGCLGVVCLSDAAHGVANFGAGAANFATSTLTLGAVHVNAPYHGPGLGAAYLSGKVTAAVETVLYGVGRVPFNPGSARVGWSSPLFGRGGSPSITGSTVKGALNRGPLRIGWGWKQGVGPVFRVGIGPYHFDIWPNGLWP